MPAKTNLQEFCEAMLDELAKNPFTAEVELLAKEIAEARRAGRTSTERENLKHIVDVLTVIAMNQAKYSNMRLLLELMREHEKDA